MFVTNKREIVWVLNYSKIVAASAHAPVGGPSICAVLGGVCFLLLNFSRCPIGFLTHAWSIKYRLITKLTAQFMTNLRDESFNPN